MCLESKAFWWWYFELLQCSPDGQSSSQKTGKKPSTSTPPRHYLNDIIAVSSTSDCTSNKVSKLYPFPQIPLSPITRAKYRAPLHHFTMSDPFTDRSSPASDDDPYSTSRPEYHIDRTGFPQPLPIIGPLLGYDDKLFANVCRRKIDGASAYLQRPLSSDEANAMAYWGAKQISILSCATPIGVVAGLWRCYDTKSKFRFPFYGPNMSTFNPFQFPNSFSGSPVLISGPRAALTWHIFRTLAYVGVGKIVAGGLIGSYAMTVVGVGEIKDPRLAEIHEKMSNDIKEGRLNRPFSGPPKQVPQQPGKQDGDSPVNASYDDASPSSGAEFYQTSVNSSTTTNELYPDKAKPSQVSRENEEEPFGMFDDASPTGGQSIIPESRPSTPTGSAWERLRSGQKSTASQSRQQTSESAWAKQRRGADDRNASDDEIARSGPKGTRRFGLEEAQMEFDAKVEQERKGGNFGDGEQKRW